MNAICSRGDLEANPYADGGYDTKVTSLNRMISTDGEKRVVLNVSIVNGPTAQNLPPFQWSKTNFTDRHLGQPDVFNFVFEDVSALPPV